MIAAAALQTRNKNTQTIARQSCQASLPFSHACNNQWCLSLHPPQFEYDLARSGEAPAGDKLADRRDPGWVNVPDDLCLVGVSAPETGYTLRSQIGELRSFYLQSQTVIYPLVEKMNTFSFVHSFYLGYLRVRKKHYVVGGGGAGGVSRSLVRSKNAQRKDELRLPAYHVSWVLVATCLKHGAKKVVRLHNDRSAQKGRDEREKER